jgi:hypothetical protein
MNLASGKSYYINGTSVLSGSTLGSGVTGSSLTSVGTITSGTWNGSVVTGTYGGTGVNNGTSTITIGGNVTFSGAYTFAGTLTGNTAVTFPTSGTIATTTSTMASGAVWNGNTIGAAYGGTGVANNAASTITISGNYGTTLTLTGTTSVTLPTSGTLATLAGTETLTNKTFNSAVTYQTSGTTIATDNVVQVTGIVTTSPTTVDSWAKATYRSAKYLVQVTQGTNYQVSEIMVIQDGTNTYMTEFAVIETNGVLATFTSSISGANAQLIVTMGSVTSATINIQRTLLAV